MTQQLGKLTFQPTEDSPELLGETVNDYLSKHGHGGVWVSAIDPSLADTAAFCEYYDIGPDVSANCVIVEGKRGEAVWHAACIILATTRADVNGAIRKTLGARKTSFAPMDTATSLTHMEYGGITPIGLPEDWPILIDCRVIQRKLLIIGSGIRGSKILITAERLQGFVNAQVLEIAK